MSEEERKELAEAPSQRSMRSGFDDLFDSFRSEFDDMMNFWWPMTPVRRRIRPTTVGYPISDIEDKGDHYELKADLPGVSKDDVDITVTNDTIEISGEQKKAKEEESENYLLRERRWASFKRSYGLPDEVLPDEAEAEMKNGILTVKVPKKEPTKIEVHKVKVK